MQIISAKVSCIMADSKHNAPRLANAAVKALGHPLRLRIYWALANDGPATATGLAQQLGLNTGDTSYHLRQLAQHDLIEAADTPGKGRERWWQINPAGFSLDRRQIAADPEVSAALALLINESIQQRALALANWLATAENESKAWLEASISTQETMTLDSERLSAMVSEVREVLAKYKHEPDRGPEAKSITVYFDAFPTVK